LQIITNNNPKTNSVDKWLWKGDKDVLLTFKWTYNVMKRDSVSENNGVFTDLCEDSTESTTLWMESNPW